jgi:hypothetical protein
MDQTHKDLRVDYNFIMFFPENKIKFHLFIGDKNKVIRIIIIRISNVCAQKKISTPFITKSDYLKTFPSK